MYYEAGLNRTEETKDDPLTYIEIHSAVNLRRKIGYYNQTKEVSRKYRKY